MSNGAEGHKGTLDELWVFILCLILLGAILWFLDDILGDAYLYIVVKVRGAIAWGASLVISNPILDAVHQYGMDVQYGASTWKSASMTSSLLGIVFRILVFIPFVYMAHRAINLKRSYSAILDFENFIKVQSRVHWAIAPIVNDNPAEDKTGKWAPRFNPVAFAKMNGIYLPKDNKFSNEVAHQVFRKQFHPKPDDLHKIPSYQLILLAGMLTQGQGKRTDAECFFEALARCYGDNGEIGDEVFTYKMLDNYLLEHECECTKDGIIRYLSTSHVSRDFEKIWSKHAFIEGVFLAALHLARKKGGVLANSDYIWLRPTNRNLWYTLNNLGRTGFLVEGSAALSHYFIEVMAGKSVSIPQVEPVVEGLKSALQKELSSSIGGEKSSLFVEV